jgi:hypothetical protein
MKETSVICISMDGSNGLVLGSPKTQNFSRWDAFLDQAERKLDGAVYLTSDWYSSDSKIVEAWTRLKRLRTHQLSMTNEYEK